MSSFDELKSSILNFFRKFSFEVDRTAKVARLKQDLKIVDLKRKEAMNRLGEKVFDLKKRETLQEANLIESLSEQFDELDDLEKQAEDILKKIQDITLMEDNTES